MKAKVLVVEDTRELADLVAAYLRKEGMEVTCTETAEEALTLVETPGWDLILLDLNLPGMDGFEFLHRYRRTGSVPVLITSARSADEDVIAGLGYGADEYVTKPFSPKVLVARVRAMLRRDPASSAPAGTLSFGPFLWDPASAILRKDGQRIALSARETQVLEYFLTHPDRPHSPDTLYREVWKNQYGDPTAVAVYVQRLRRKIEDDPSAPKWIETLFGMGYRFNRNGGTPGGEVHP